MNKADLVNLVAARTELTKTDVSAVVDAAIETIKTRSLKAKRCRSSVSVRLSPASVPPVRV